MNQDELKTNLLNADQWLRILWMAIIAILAWLTAMGLGILVLAQVVVALVLGEANVNLRKLGYLLCAYLHECVLFLTYNSQKKPFPFADFPSTDGFEENLGSPKEAQPANPEAPASEVQDQDFDSQDHNHP